MGFVPANLGNLTRFNSATASNLINIYDDALKEQIIVKSSRARSQTFAPSSIRCPRISWFRLRGVQPDKVSRPDKTLEFTAAVGSACHEMIQKALSEKLKSDWIDVEDYLKDLNPQYKYEVNISGYETQVSIEYPPVRFAVDGIIQLNGIKYLLEIKSSEYRSWSDLSDPKPIHIDQVRCYASLLNLENVLMIYIDRQYGDIKCFEIKVSLDERQKVWNMFQYVQDMVDANLAPDKLPVGDSWCNPAMCNYYEKCKQW